MKRSPLSAPAFQGRSNYKWKSKPRGYSYAKSVSSNNQTRTITAVPGSDDFIPLNSLSPPTFSANDQCWQQQQQQQHNANFSTRHNRNNSMGYNHYHNANNYLPSPRTHYGNSPYKQSGKFYQGQNKNFQKGGHRQMEISRYIDLKSILEDPWAELTKIANDKYELLTSFGSNLSQESRNESIGSCSFDEKAQKSSPGRASVSFDDSFCTSPESKNQSFEECSRSQSLSQSSTESSI